MSSVAAAALWLPVSALPAKPTLQEASAQPQRAGCLDQTYFVIFGQVAQPGKYPLPVDADVTVGAALKQAGGPTISKGLPKIKIIRKTPQGNKFILVNAHSVLVQQSGKHDLFLRKDDVVLVE